MSDQLDRDCAESKWSSTNTTAKITVLVLLALGVTSCFFLGTEAKDVLIGITSGLVGFLSREVPKPAADR